MPKVGQQTAQKPYVDDATDPQAAMAEVMEGTPICGLCNDTGVRKGGERCSPCISSWMRKSPTCIVCGDTGVNSRGGTCVPCERRAMMEWLKEPAKVDIPVVYRSSGGI